MTPSLRIAGGVLGIPMLAVAIVALFWGSVQALVLGIVLGVLSLYLIWSAVHIATARFSKSVPNTTRSGVGAWVVRIILAGIVGFAGFVWGLLAVAHKCSLGVRAVESYAPYTFGLVCAGTLIACRRYIVGLLVLIVLFVLALLGGFFYKETIHRGRPEGMPTRANKTLAINRSSGDFWRVCQNPAA